MRFDVLRPDRQELAYSDAGPPEDPQHEVVPGTTGLRIIEKRLHLFTVNGYISKRSYIIIKKIDAPNNKQ